MKGIATLLMLTLSPFSAYAQTAVQQTAPKPTATPVQRTQTTRPAPTPTPAPRTNTARPSTAPKPTPTPAKSPANTKNPKSKPTPTPAKDPKVELDKAIALTDPEERIVAFQDFLAFFPNSPDVRRIKELMVSARAELADKLLEQGEKEDGIEMFKTAVTEAPAPVSDELFSKVILNFPTAIFARDERNAAFEVAASIEELAGGNPKQLLGVATFYLSVQYGTEAIRIAKKAVEIAPDLPLAYYTLGAATRLNFRLDESADAYAKALALEPGSSAARRNLADIKRALGKSDEAAKLYRQLIEKDSSDQAARSSLALCLFDLGNRDEAEAEMAKALEANPLDVKLLSGAAFWYAANGEAAKAIELGQKAQKAAPNFTWGYIAEARGHLARKKPLDAERVLLIARATGNFPTLNYELASARYAAGLYREAVDILATSFEFKDGAVSAYLGNRVLADSESIVDLLRLERKATVLEPNIEDDDATASALKGLLEFSAALTTTNGVDEAELLKGANLFVGNKDKMQPHRQLFVASRLLTNKLAIPKAVEFTRAAVPGLDESLKVATPVAAVLADELYESRVSALARGEMVVVPDISGQTLISVLRGRVEELTGWAFLLQNEPAQAVLRFRRGLTVLPEKSVWWRTSLWRMGNALEADKKPNEALEAYIRAYDKDNPDAGKYVYIEGLFKQMYGTLEGLTSRIGERPAQTVAESEAPTPNAAENSDSSAAKQKTTDSVPNKAVDGKTNPKVAFIEAPPREIAADEPPPRSSTVSKGLEPDAFDDVDGDQAAREELGIGKNQAPKPPALKPIKSAPALPEVATQTLPMPDVATPQVQSDPAPEEKLEHVETATSPKPKRENPSEATADSPPKTETPQGPQRARIVNKSSGDSSPQCSLIPTRDAVTIFSNGGLWGLLVDVRNGDPKQLTASSESPSDVTVTRESSPSGESRVFFAIRSVSTKTGDFKIFLSSPCGKKEVLVTVRGL